MTGPNAPDRDDAALAAEFALHLLDAGERAAFEKRLAVEPALQALVREWDEHFVALASEVESVAPPRRLKQEITTRLHGPENANNATPLWLRWRLGIGGVVLVALVGLAVMFGDIVSTKPTGAMFSAEVAAQDRSLVVQARLDSATGEVVVEHILGAPPEGRVLEMWLIAKAATAPVSLGVFAGSGSTTLAVPEAQRAQFAEGVLAISDEPPGGSPTGAPTGSVLATGPVTAL